MAYPKGKPRHPNSGRPKGLPNKATQDLLAICEAKGINLFAAMLDIAMAEPDPAKQFDMYEKCAQYVLPKRKALDIKLEDLTPEEFAKEAERRLHMVKLVGGSST